MDSSHFHDNFILPLYFHLKLSNVERSSIFPSWTWVVLLFITVVLTTVFVVRAVYNRYLHPLQHIPGPFWSSITDLYKLVALTSPDVTKFSLDLHLQHGPVVRVAPDLVSISDPAMLPLIYHRHADKDDFWTPGALGESAPMLQTRNAEEHMRKKKVCAPILSRSSLMRYEDRVDTGLSKLMQRLRSLYSSKKRPADISEWTKYFLRDTSSHIMFGGHTSCVDQGRDVNGILAAFRESAWFIGLMCIYPYVLQPLINLPIIRDIVLPQTGDHAGIGKIMTQRDALISNPKFSKEDSLVSQFIAHQQTHATSISTDSLHAELLMMMVAAPDTTSATICAFLTHITSHPLTLSKIQAEISAAVRDGTLTLPKPTYAQIRTLPFFNACLNETLRLSPPIPVLLPRRVSAGGVWLDGHFIPEGTSVGASAPVINRDKGVFGNDSDQWRPERWLEADQSDRARVRAMKRFLFSFGWGARKCGGREMAMMEASKLLLRLVHDFDIEVVEADGKPCTRREIKGFALYEGMNVMLSER